MPSAHAGAEGADRFEVNALYGSARDLPGNLDLYGASVAGGHYFGNHLLQMEVGALFSESMGGGVLVATNPLNPSELCVVNFTEADLQRIPVWAHYRYGVSFGPGDSVRFEAGPLLGASLDILRTEYDLTVSDGTTVKTYRGGEEQTGGVAFNYGLSAALRVAVAEHWAVTAGYRFVRSTKIEFEHEYRELGTSAAWVYSKGEIPEHNTHYASVGVEYRF